ncbi:hypothetical protein DAPPUDRAFT_343527, partial [Daphnia pulex]
FGAADLGEIDVGGAKADIAAVFAQAGRVAHAEAALEVFVPRAAEQGAAALRHGAEKHGGGAGRCAQLAVLLQLHGVVEGGAALARQDDLAALFVAHRTEHIAIARGDEHLAGVGEALAHRQPGVAQQDAGARGIGPGTLGQRGRAVQVDHAAAAVEQRTGYLQPALVDLEHAQVAVAGAAQLQRLAGLHQHAATGLVEQVGLQACALARATGHAAHEAGVAQALAHHQTVGLHCALVDHQAREAACAGQDAARADHHGVRRVEGASGHLQCHQAGAGADLQGLQLHGAAGAGDAQAVCCIHDHVMHVGGVHAQRPVGGVFPTAAGGVSPVQFGGEQKDALRAVGEEGLIGHLPVP